MITELSKESPEQRLTEAEEFFDIYKALVVSIPTYKKMLRKDYNDQIYRTEKLKYNAITNKIIECNNKRSASLSRNQQFN